MRDPPFVLVALFERRHETLVRVEIDRHLLKMWTIIDLGIVINRYSFLIRIIALLANRHLKAGG